MLLSPLIPRSFPEVRRDLIRSRVPFTPLAVERGLEPGTDAITLFAGQGPTALVDQLSRTPDSLVRSMAATLRAQGHPKLALGMDAMLVVGPEHGYSEEAEAHHMRAVPPA